MKHVASFLMFRTNSSSIQIQLEDGEFVDAELKDFEAEDERGEFAPAVVELDEHGREKGLFSF